jgi:uncharacterized membrane protein YphA (DoxX/SURF4 family)
MLGKLLAVARILSGLCFFICGVLLLRDDTFIYGGLMHGLSGLGRPFPFFRPFLNRFVELRQTQVAELFAAAAIVIGVLLVIGLMVSWASLGAAGLLSGVLFATTYGSPLRLSAGLAAILAMLVLGRMAAGVTWGLDGWLLRHLKDWLVLFPLRLEVPRR